jgi:O-antigen/teichoic acid export membrane protein
MENHHKIKLANLRLANIKIIYLLFSRCSNILSSFLVFAILVRLVPRSELESIALATTWIGILAICFDFGFNELVIRRIAQIGKIDKNAVQTELFTKLSIVFITIVVLCPLMLLLYGRQQRIELIFASLLAAVVRSISDFTETSLISLGEYQSVFKFTIMQSLVALGGGLIVTQLITDDAAIFIASQAILSLTVVVPRLLYLNCFNGDLVNSRINFYKLPAILRQCVPFGVMSVAGNLSVSAPVIYLSFYSHAGEIAPMQAAVRIWTTLLSFGSGPFTRLYAIFSREKSVSNSLTDIVKLALFGFNVSVFIVSLIILFWGESLFSFIYTTKLIGSFSAFNSLAVSLPFVFMAMVPGAWLPANMGEKLKMVIVMVFCLLMYATIFQGKSAKNNDQCADIVSLAWIFQSICLLISARCATGMPLRLIDSIICPLGTSIMLLGQRNCSPWMTWSGGLLAFGCLSLGWFQIRRNIYENNR